MAKPCSNLKMPSISATEGCLDPGGSLKKKKNLISACGRAFNNSSEGKKKKKKICGN